MNRMLRASRSLGCASLPPSISVENNDIVHNMLDLFVIRRYTTCVFLYLCWAGPACKGLFSPGYSIKIQMEILLLRIRHDQFM